MKYAFRGLTVEECFLQPPEFHAECILEPENNADTTVLSKLLAGCTVYADSSDSLPAIKNVYFNDPVTVVLWDDGTKTIVKCQEGDTYSKEVGLALCISKKALGNKGNYNDIFKKWIPEEKKTESEKDSIYRGDCTNCKYCDLREDESPCCDCKMTKWEPAK